MKSLSYYLPNKFTLKHRMLMLYKQQNDTANIKKAALEILNLPVKVPSAEVDQIMNEAKVLFNNYGI
jgi:hypothetical protein